MSSSSNEEIMFYGTYVPWDITKKVDNRMAILNQFRTGWPNFGSTGFYIPVHENIDETDPRRLRNDYDAMFSEMLGRIALGFGLRPFRFVTTKESEEVKFRGIGSSRDEIAEIYDIFYYGLSTHDFDNLLPNLDVRILRCWKDGFQELKTALPFITTEPGLYILKQNGSHVTFEEVG